MFHPLAARLGVIAVAPAGVALWSAGPLAAAGVGVGFLGLDLWRVKRTVTRAMPDTISFSPANRAEAPWIDEDGFRSHLAELAALGFRPIADYRPDYPGAPKGFGRVLVNPRIQAYAEVNQVVEQTGPTEVTTTIMSLMSDGWSLSTTSREAWPVYAAFMSAPQAAWRSVAGASARDLVADHLELRSAMCRDLSLAVGGNGTMEDFLAAQSEQHERRRATVRSTSIVRALLRGLAWERRPGHEWLGGYRPAAS